MRKIKLVINGSGWDTDLNIIEIEGDKLMVDRKDFEKFLNVLSYTHDRISGGFDYKFKEV